MTRQDILIWLKELFYDRYGVERDEIVESAHVAHDLGFDSLDQAEIMNEVEIFHCVSSKEMKDYVIEDMLYVKNMIDFIEKCYKNK